MSQLTRGQTVGIVALLAIVTGWVGVNALHSGPSVSTPGIVVRESLPASNSNASPPLSAGPGATAPALSSTASEMAGSEIVVHVAGAVKKPGVYHLKPGARNDEALHAAGGFTSSANPDAVNLAARCVDGSQLYIPTRAEQSSGGSAPHEAAASTVTTPTESRVASHSKSARSGGQSGHASSKFSDPAQGQINLNTADAAQLQHIPGIGPAMAERILAYRRTAGTFQTTDDMLQIPGIGVKKFEKMKAYLTVR